MATVTNSNRTAIKVLIYADFRSPHAKAWADGMIEAGVTVIRLSSHQVSEFKDDGEKTNAQGTRQRIATWLHTTNGPLGKVIRWLPFRQWIHSIFYLLITSRHEVNAIRHAIEQHKPDLIHSLRIPYESVSVLKAEPQIPWIVSTWGQDFVPQASSDWLLRRWTRTVLANVDGVTYDSPPDYKRALAYGLNPNLPHIYCAGNLGVNTNIFYDDSKPKTLVVYPRKMSPYSNYLAFVEVSSRLIEKSKYQFVAIGLEQIRPEINRRHPELSTEKFITTGTLDQASYGEYIRRAKVVVSPNYSDGTPNSILEALAAGSIVVAGYLPQLKHLAILNPHRLFLIDPEDSEQIEHGILAAIDSDPQSALVLPDAYERDKATKMITELYSFVVNSNKTIG